MLTFHMQRWNTLVIRPKSLLIRLVGFKLSLIFIFLYWNICLIWMHSASQSKRSFFTSVRVSEFDTALYWACSCSFKKIKWPHQLCTQARTPNKKKNTSTLIWTEPFKRGYRAPYSVSLVSTLNNHFPPGNKTRCPRHSAEALKNTHFFIRRGRASSSRAFVTILVCLFLFL